MTFDMGKQYKKHQAADKAAKARKNIATKIKIRSGQHLTKTSSEEHRLHKEYPGLFESIARGGTRHNK